VRYALGIRINLAMINRSDWKEMHKSRFTVGIVLVVIAILMFLFGDFATAGVIAIGVLGLISIFDLEME